MAARAHVLNAIRSGLLDTASTVQFLFPEAEEEMRRRPRAHALERRIAEHVDVLKAWRDSGRELPLQQLRLVGEASTLEGLRALDGVKAPKLSLLEMHKREATAAELLTFAQSSRLLTTQLKRWVVELKEPDLAQIAPLLDPKALSKTSLDALTLTDGNTHLITFREPPGAFKTLRVHSNSVSSPTFPKLPALLAALPRGFKVLELYRTGELIVSETSAAILAAAKRYGPLKVVWPKGSV